MNVRVLKRDFTHEDFTGVERIKESWGGDEVYIEDSSCEELARFESRDITSIEIRL